WVHLGVDTDVVLQPGPATRLLTRLSDRPSVLLPAADAAQRTLELERLSGESEIFEVVGEPGTTRLLVQEHNEMPIYTWGDARCCLERHTTRATLAGHFPRLEPGTPLLFEEVRGARTGRLADADPERRHVVWLTQVEHSRGGAPLTDPLTGQAVTEITWAGEDELP
ncbi:MAG: putative baseplate assembly protein, partial [Rhodocyclaceae bacterium]|nr:putative baseplate assembly protein [Rhodocyclaceae bacterium]